ncbi:hypothetical protein AURDEDRAFT_129468 [Auricularia subglabra TFB-10046 SS5]|nr:hypothetical protein AURDEDRAFT_129468 [Auricularia subglabra TFB-10046 SS5]
MEAPQRPASANDLPEFLRLHLRSIYGNLRLPSNPRDDASQSLRSVKNVLGRGPPLGLVGNEEAFIQMRVAHLKMGQPSAAPPPVVAPSVWPKLRKAAVQWIKVLQSNPGDMANLLPAAKEVVRGKDWVERRVQSRSGLQVMVGKLHALVYLLEAGDDLATLCKDSDASLVKHIGNNSRICFTWPMLQVALSASPVYLLGYKFQTGPQAASIEFLQDVVQATMVGNEEEFAKLEHRLLSVLFENCFVTPESSVGHLGAGLINAFRNTELPLEALARDVPNRFNTVSYALDPKAPVSGDNPDRREQSDNRTSKRQRVHGPVDDPDQGSNTDDSPENRHGPLSVGFVLPSAPVIWALPKSASSPGMIASANGEEFPCTNDEGRLRDSDVEMDQSPGHGHVAVGALLPARPNLTAVDGMDLDDVAGAEPILPAFPQEGGPGLLAEEPIGDVQMDLEARDVSPRRDGLQAPEGGTPDTHISRFSQRLKQAKEKVTTTVPQEQALPRAPPPRRSQTHGRKVAPTRRDGGGLPYLDAGADAETVYGTREEPTSVTVQEHVVLVHKGVHSTAQFAQRLADMPPMGILAAVPRDQFVASLSSNRGRLCSPVLLQRDETFDSSQTFEAAIRGRLGLQTRVHVHVPTLDSSADGTINREALRMWAWSDFLLSSASPNAAGLETVPAPSSVLPPDLDETAGSIDPAQKIWDETTFDCEAVDNTRRPHGFWFAAQRGAVASIQDECGRGTILRVECGQALVIVWTGGDTNRGTGTRVTIREGDILYLPAGTAYTRIMTENTVIIGAHLVPPETLAATVSRLAKGDRRARTKDPLPPGISSTLSHIARQCLRRLAFFPQTETAVLTASDEAQQIPNLQEDSAWRPVLSCVASVLLCAELFGDRDGHPGPTTEYTLALDRVDLFFAWYWRHGQKSRRFAPTFFGSAMMMSIVDELIDFARAVEKCDPAEKPSVVSTLHCAIGKMREIWPPED